jgi:hypothetical protein
MQKNGEKAQYNKTDKEDPNVCFTLIGECYIDGMMDGEANHGREPEYFKLK